MKYHCISIGLDDCLLRQRHAESAHCIARNGVEQFHEMNRGGPDWICCEDDDNVVSRLIGLRAEAEAYVLGCVIKPRGLSKSCPLTEVNQIAVLVTSTHPPEVLDGSAVPMLGTKGSVSNLMSTGGPPTKEGWAMGPQSPTVYPCARPADHSGLPSPTNRFRTCVSTRSGRSATSRVPGPAVAHPGCCRAYPYMRQQQQPGNRLLLPWVESVRFLHPRHSTRELLLLVAEEAKQQSPHSGREALVEGATSTAH